MDFEQTLRHSSALPIRARSEGRSQPLGLHWQQLAIGLLALSWLTVPAPAEAQTCSHDLCEVGAGLNPNCDPCVDTICNSPYGDPYCCSGQGEWDAFCIEKVLDVCGDWSCAAACSHSLCQTGDPLDSTCNACAAEICFGNPSCCTDSWDESCVNRVATVCESQCQPGANLCANALPISPGTIFGTLMGASNDGCETGNDSCRSADVWYSYTQQVDEQFAISTCMTENSFGIDTVLSVHTGCPGVKNNQIRANDDYLLGLLPTACNNFPLPHFLDAALPFGGGLDVAVGETVVIRVAHHDDSVRGNFELRVLPEPKVWMALVAGAGALGVLSRRRARR